MLHQATIDICENYNKQANEQNAFVARIDKFLRYDVRDGLEHKLIDEYIKYESFLRINLLYKMIKEKPEYLATAKESNSRKNRVYRGVNLFRSGETGTKCVICGADITENKKACIVIQKDDKKYDIIQECPCIGGDPAIPLWEEFTMSESFNKTTYNNYYTNMWYDTVIKENQEFPYLINVKYKDERKYLETNNQPEQVDKIEDIF